MSGPNRGSRTELTWGRTTGTAGCHRIRLARLPANGRRTTPASPNHPAGAPRRRLFVLSPTANSPGCQADLGQQRSQRPMTWTQALVHRLSYLLAPRFQNLRQTPTMAPPPDCPPRPPPHRSLTRGYPQSGRTDPPESEPLPRFLKTPKPIRSLQPAAVWPMQLSARSWPSLGTALILALHSGTIHGLSP